MTEEAVLERIRQTIEESQLVLYMHGTAMYPHTSLSAAAALALDSQPLPWKGVDLSTDPPLEEGVKRFSGWPNMPQLFMDGVYALDGKEIRQMNREGRFGVFLLQNTAREQMYKE